MQRDAKDLRHDEAGEVIAALDAFMNDAKSLLDMAARGQ
jgi:hypothetical protein